MSFSAGAAWPMSISPLIARQAHIAVKILREDLAEDPDFVRRFEHEAEALARLDHPNIVRFY